MKATYFESTGLIEVTDQTGNIKTGDSYERLSQSEAMNDEVVRGLASVARVKMDEVEFVDLIYIKKTNDGPHALLSFETGTQTLGKAAILGLIPLPCKK